MKQYFENFTVRDWVINALIAAIYVVLTITPPLNAMAYGQIQLRISEIMVMLPFLNHKFVPGMTAGCLIANMFSTTAAVDIVVGTLASFIVFIIIIHVKHGIFVPFIAAVVNGIIIGEELHFMIKVPFLITAVYIFIGEFIAVFIGYILFKLMMKNTRINQLIKN